MKKTIGLMLLVAGSLLAAEMPSEVELTTGRVLRNTQVIRWEKNRVVLRHSGGVDPIAFDLIKSLSRAELDEMARADEENKRLQEKIASERTKANEEAAREAERLERLVRDRKVAVGMSFDQVRQAWGQPYIVNSVRRGNTHRWVYTQEMRSVLFENDRVKEWRDGDKSSNNEAP